MTHALPAYPAYRDSGVDWLGEIPAHWEVKRLKHAVQINTATLPENTDPEYPLRYVDIGNVDTNGRFLNAEEMTFAAAPSRARRRVHPGDTVISTVRTYLKAIAFVEDNAENLIVSTGFATLTPKVVVLPKFFWRAVQSEYFVSAVVMHSEGVGYPAITPSNLAALPVWLPPLPEQRAIAAFLDRETARLDALIAKKERLLALLAEKRAALISHAVTKGLDPSAPMRDSGIAWLGEIPAHWEVKPLGVVARLQRGHDLPSNDRQSGEFPVVSSSGVCDSHSVAKVRGPGVVTGRYSTIGKVFYIEGDYWPLNTALYVCDFKGSHPRFIYYLIGLLPFDAYSGKSAVPGIDRNDLHPYPVACPPSAEQSAIATLLDRGISEIDRLSAKVNGVIDKLREYRAALISAAATGKIDVRGEAAVHEQTATNARMLAPRFGYS